jgi:V/A-type H+/Na+-transporting ATPase subunit D
MATVALSKASLQKERENLRLYERILPSLDMKRMQLTGQLARARQQLAQEQEEASRMVRLIAEQLPMLANRQIELAGLVKVLSVRIEQENAVGVKLPVLKQVHATVQDYSMLAEPHWVDLYVQQYKHMLHLKAAVKVSEVRIRKLDHAVRRITQRVNLFDKILIPEAKKNIKRVQIFLADMDRAATVRSKIAKAMRIRKANALKGQEATP